MCHNVLFQLPVVLHRSDLEAFVSSMCNVVHYSGARAHTHTHTHTHTRGGNINDVTKTFTMKNYVGPPTQKNYRPARIFKGATTNKPNKTVS
jgi:hypothetical protein